MKFGFGSKFSSSSANGQVKQEDSASLRNSKPLFGFPQSPKLPPNYTKSNDIKFIKSEKRTNMPIPFGSRIKFQQNRSDSSDLKFRGPAFAQNGSSNLSTSMVRPISQNSSKMFLFPPEEFKQIKFSETEQILDYLNKGIMKLGPQYGKRGYSMKNQFGLIVFKCDQCDSRITFSKPQNFKLMRFQNRHKHDKVTIEKEDDPKISSYLMAIPFIQGSFMNTDIRFHIQEKFKVSKQKAKAIAEKFFKSYMDLDFILEKISKEHKVTFKKFFNQEDNETSAVIMITDQMKERYHKYGNKDALVIDLRKRMLTNVNQNGKLWQILFFYGQDMDLNVVVFATCLIADRTPEMYYTVFQNFFQMMDNQKPATIITKDLPDLVIALKEINKAQIQIDKKFSYMLDWRAKLRKVRNNLIAKKYAEDQIKTMIIWFGQLLQEPSLQRYQKILLQNKIHKIQEDVVEAFLQNKQETCLSHFPEKMCGFSPSTSRNDLYNEMLRKYYKPGQNFAKFFFYLMKHQLTQVEKEANYSSQMTMKNRFEELEPVLQRLQGKLGDKMLQNYRDVVDMDSIKRNEDGTQYQVIFKGIVQNLRYIADRWICSCKYNQKIGIPCMHQLKIIGRNSGMIFRHINQRWLKPIPKIQHADGTQQPDSVLDRIGNPMKTQPKHQDKDKLNKAAQQERQKNGMETQEQQKSSIDYQKENKSLGAKDFYQSDHNEGNSSQQKA